MSLMIKFCEDGNEWNSYLEYSPHSTVFHRWEFLRVMEKYSISNFLGEKSQATLLPLMFFDGDKPIALLPIFFHNAHFIRYASSPGSGASYQGPVLLDTALSRQKTLEYYLVEMQKTLDDFLFEKVKANLVKIYTSPMFHDVRAFTWAGYRVEPLYNYEFDLRHGTQQVWDNFDKSAKNAINKAIREGLVVEEGTKEDLEKLINKVSSRYSEKGLRADVRKEYIRDLYTALSPCNFTILSVKKNSEFLSGAIGLTYKNKASLWIGMPKTKTPGLYPNDLLQWGMVCWAYNKGFQTFENLWANTYSLCRYKTNFDPRTAVYYSCEKRSPMVHILYSIKNIKRSRIALREKE